MTSFPVKCKHITLSFPYKVKVKGQRSKVGFDPEPASTHLLQEQKQLRSALCIFFFCQYIFYKDGQIANRS